MANIFGTIISVGDFLNRKAAEVSIVRGDGTNQRFFLSENRKYLIPDYQREIRWDQDNLKELITDISQGDKFLGNIILNKRSTTEYEVIDGQQRITVLLMTIYYIKNKFSNDLDILETCKLEMANFDRFDFLVEKNFDLDHLSQEDTILMEKSDIFNQRKRYRELWRAFDNIRMLQNAVESGKILTNIKRSQFNILANTIETDNDSIDYFLDVNLKGVKLDTEDKFKGYLFSQDSKQSIRDEWKTFKIRWFKLNEIKPYPSTKLIEHYFYCDLYKHERYKNIQFKEDFSISEIEIDGLVHCTGEHIIKVINSTSYMLQSIKNINTYLVLILDVLNNETPSQSFKTLFNPNAKVDNIEISIIHNFIKKIMQDKNVVPRILIMKYVTEVLSDSQAKTKDDYRKIYGVYLLAVLFTIFESNKEIKKIQSVVKDRDWYAKIVEQSKSYFSRGKISNARITVQYKMLDYEDTESYMYRCKSLATIYNFFEIRTETVSIKNGKINDLKTYLSDSERFSNEHFIINNSRAYRFNLNTRNINYPAGIRKYSNSIFNFIFISKQLNQELDNFTLAEKIRIIKEKLSVAPSTIECEFSKMIIERCEMDFKKILNIATENIDIAEQESNLFYQNDFFDVFFNYSSEVIKKIADRLGIL